MKYINQQNFDHSVTPKIGVLLVNLGTPEAPTANAVRPYLKQFLSDPRVVEIPRLLWLTILNGFILPFRSKKSAHAYQQIWTEQGSPLLVNTRNIQSGLAKEFADSDVIVEFSMRYGKPSIDDKLASLIAQGATKLLVLPLYPQFSATTTGSTFDAVTQALSKRRWFPELRFVNQYHDDKDYIEALANKIEDHWTRHGQAERLVLSFHGIPKRFWLNGDPYVCHCFKTARLLRARLGLKDEQLLTCFQSRFGKAEWVKPYLDATLKSLPEQGVKSVQVVSPGFSADCLETLEEIAVENQTYFKQAGGERFEYIPCLNDDDAHIKTLRNIIAQHIHGWSVDTTEQIDALIAKKQTELDKLD